MMNFKENLNEKIYMAKVNYSQAEIALEQTLKTMLMQNLEIYRHRDQSRQALFNS